MIKMLVNYNIQRRL